MPDSTHLNLHNLFITKNMKLHPQNQLLPPLVFEILVLLVSLGMPDHTHLKSHHQFLALIDMYMLAKNQLYAVKSFLDIIPLIPGGNKKATHT